MAGMLSPNLKIRKEEILSSWFISKMKKRLMALSSGRPLRKTPPIKQMLQACQPINLRTTIHFMIIVTLFDIKLQKELSLNRIAGPFERHPFQFFFGGGVFKKHVIFFRIIDDLSHPEENAVNLHNKY